MDCGTRIVLIASLPDPEDMCSLEVSINPSEKHDSSAKSDCHWRILICRQLILSEQQIIASPDFGTENQIHIVLTWEFFRSKQFHKCVQNLKLLIKEPKSVTSSIYESCLRYTILARMAPLWNQVGNYLVHGRDFLTSNNPLEAVKMDISVNGREFFIILWPLRLQMGRVILDKLDIPSNINQDSSSKSSISPKFVYVLPSFKKGKIVRICHTIPRSCLYKTYNMLRRHWKNMYGYRLPVVEGKVLYYSISFHPMSRTIYTYPHVCVRPQKAILLRSLGQMKILRNFHDDLLKKLPSVCGEKWGIDKNLAYAVRNIPKNEQFSGNSVFPNLRFTNLVEMKPRIISQSISHHCSTHKGQLNGKIMSGIKDQTKIGKKESSLKTSGESSGNTDLVAKAKKPFSRPQVQLDVDVEMRARNDDLARVNAPTLVHWLRSKFVRCKVKDKKSDLVDKVKTYLNISC